MRGPSAGVWILLPLHVWQGRGPGGFIPSLAVTLPRHKLLPLQNHSNSDVVSIDCNVKLAPNEEMNLHLRGNLWMKSLKAVSPPKADTRLLSRNPPKEPSHHKNVAFFLSCNCLPSQGAWTCVGRLLFSNPAYSIGVCIQHPARHLIVGNVTSSSPFCCHLTTLPT